MSKTFYNGIKLGVIGGGQLGRMLIQQGINYNIYFSVLDPDVNAPCKTIANEFTLGSLTDFDTVYNFGKKADIITIEIEHVNIEALEKLEAEGKTVYPQPAILKMIQDKGLQKNFYRENNIPTPDYFLVNNKSEIAQYASHFPFMQKMRKGGYDGKGVTKLADVNNLQNAFDVPSVLEKLVDFKKEIAVIVARNAAGDCKCFPLVEMDFSKEANLVEFLFSPADVSPQVEKDAYTIATTIAEKLGIVGILAVELFLTQQDEVLVNEIAPRPHNSGHQTIEGNVVSQYEQQLRCIFNLPLGDTSIIQPSVMINLLGEKGFEGDAIYQNIHELLDTSGVYIHLYGKKTTKPFRKMGHVTVVDKSLEVARKKALAVKEQIKIVA